jgi:endonuclease YncB( thermonuclease family)
MQTPPRPLLGQIAIWFGAALAGLLGIGIVGAIAAPSNPQTEVAATTALPTIPSTVVPVTVPVVVLTAELVDGDTIAMSDGSTVRLIGIDTPERGECGFDEASAVLGQLITGQSVTLVPGARDDVDRYGRLLRYVEVNGIDADLMMIESGRAIARYDGRDGYGTHPRQDAYVQADAATPSLNVCAPPAVLPIADLPADDVYYANCTEVRAAGADPIYAGDPGWQSKFDSDHDGVGCE